MNQSALEGFVKIVELNSYSAAAEALYLSQSALSQQIRTLEGQLGVELFQHVPRKVLLTPAGVDFYPRAKQMVPLLYYRRPDLRFARLLDWNKGHRFGIVAGQKADDPVVRGYVQALQQAFPALTGPLFGVELEKIEV